MADLASGPWHPEVFSDDNGNEPFTRFLEGLDDFKAVALDTAIRVVLARRGLDLVRTEWLKALGQGLHEFRIRHTAGEIARMFGDHEDPAVAAAAKGGDVLLRVFVHFHGQRVILLLSGYDKGEDPKERAQQREIAEARRLLRAWRAQEAEKAAKGGRRGRRSG